MLKNERDNNNKRKQKKKKKEIMGDGGDDDDLTGGLSTSLEEGIIVLVAAEPEDAVSELMNTCLRSCSAVGRACGSLSKQRRRKSRNGGDSCEGIGGGEVVFAM